MTTKMKLVRQQNAKKRQEVYDNLPAIEKIKLAGKKQLLKLSKGQDELGELARNKLEKEQNDNNSINT